MRPVDDVYRTIATATAPPTMAMTSRVRPVVMAAPPVCRPAWPVVVAADCGASAPVGLTWITVVAVMVLRLPSGRVEVLL